MDFGAALLYPFRWLVSAIMIGLHHGLSTAGMPAASGWTWTLSIVGLVLAIRAALLPLSLQQIRAQRRLRLLRPDLMKLQEKFRGKTDPLSRQAMAQEQMDLYKQHGTNPFSACLPALVQVPFFFALFTVLSGIGPAAARGQGLAAMSAEQVAQFEASSIFGAPLSASLLNRGPGDPFSVSVLAILMILAMTAAQFITQRHIMTVSGYGKLSEGPVPAPFVRQRRAVLYVLPVVFGAGGIIFPLGVLIYWTTTNFWTMAQQFVLDPTPP